MSAVLDVSFKVLYVQGLAVDVDRTATEQLRASSAELQITTIAGSAAALAELRRTPGWQALFASPSLPQNEVLALIASLRRDRIPIAIIPILDEAHQDLFASAVAAGADDVLVRRNGVLVNVGETLTRIRQSPHLFPAEQRRRISVLYAGRDPLVWNLLDQVPFVKADRVVTGIDGACSVRRPGAGDDSLRADAVIIDETPGEAHPLQVLKSVKAQASDLPVIMLTSAGAADIATAALELGADDTVLKTGIFRRRLIATLRRVHQRLELTAQQQETKAREERLRQIVENVPTGIIVVAGDGAVLAMNAAALQLFAATKPRDIVGRDFRDLVGEADRDAVTQLIRDVSKGEAGGLTFEARTLAGGQVTARIDAVVLERAARGGRGLVASLTRAVPAAVEGGASQAATGELASLRDALQTLERHYGELEDARVDERAAWESERQRLEARLEHAEREAAERQTLEERLTEVTAELARTSQSFAEERQALERRLHDLDDALREASAVGAARADLERALEDVREQQRQAIAAHALERSGWQEIRAELETRVQQLDATQQATQDALVASLRNDVQRLEQMLAEQQARWDAARNQLESELHNAREALWAEHSDRDAARAAADAELTELRVTLDRERSDWDATRRTLEDARQRVEAALEHERTEWTERRLAFEHEQRQWAERDAQAGDLAEQRRRLESELDTARQQWAAERAEMEAARLRLEAERDQALAALAQSRTALEEAAAGLSQREREWHDERSQLTQAAADARSYAEQERGHLVSLHARELEEWRKAVEQARAERARPSDAALEADLAEARRLAEQQQDLAEALEAARSEIRHTDEARRVDREAWERDRQALEQELRELAARHGEAQEAWDRARTKLEAAADEAARLGREQHFLNDTIAGLRADCAALSDALADERAGRDRQRHEVDRMRAALADSESHLAEMDVMLDRASRSADQQLADQIARYEARQHQLEDELATLAMRLARTLAGAEATEAGLRAEISRATGDLDRLIASDTFGYAITTLQGEVIRCNDAFARLFGFLDAGHVRTSTARQPFPALGARPEITARLEAEGQITRLESCVERADGQAQRIIESATLLAGDPALIEHLIVAGPAGPTTGQLQDRRVRDVGTLAAGMAPALESLAADLQAKSNELVQLGDLAERWQDASAIAQHVHAVAEPLVSLIRQLGAFSRRQTRDLAPVDLSSALRAAQPVLERLVGSSVAFSIGASHAAVVTADADDLDQLLTTAATIGRDLLPAGGSVTVDSSQRGNATASVEIGAGPALTLRATGHGVQLPADTTTLERLAERCGATLHVSRASERSVQIEMLFSRCGRPASRS